MIAPPPQRLRVGSFALSPAQSLSQSRSPGTAWPPPPTRSARARGARHASTRQMTLAIIHPRPNGAPGGEVPMVRRPSPRVVQRRLKVHLSGAHHVGGALLRRGARIPLERCSSAAALHSAAIREGGCGGTVSAVAILLPATAPRGNAIWSLLPLQRPCGHWNSGAYSPRVGKQGYRGGSEVPPWHDCTRPRSSRGRGRRRRVNLRHARHLQPRPTRHGRRGRRDGRGSYPVFERCALDVYSGEIPGFGEAAASAMKDVLGKQALVHHPNDVTSAKTYAGFSVRNNPSVTR